MHETLFGAHYLLQYMATTCTQNTHHLLCVCIVWAGELASIAACLYMALSLLAEHPTVYSFRSLVQADIRFLNA